MADRKLKINSYNLRDQDEALNGQNIYINYSADYSTGHHNYIHNSCELLFVEQGKAEYRINHVSYTVEKNDILIIGAMDTHSRNIMQVPYIRYGLTLLPSYIGVLPVLNEYANIFRTPGPSDFTRLKNIDNDTFLEIISILLKLHIETTTEQSGRSEMIHALLQELTIILKRLLNFEKREWNQTDSYQLMIEVRNYIDFHYKETLSLDSLSNHFFLQPSTISRNFKNSFNININRYINMVRISNAVRLLEQSPISITQLSEQVGYLNVNTFIRQFHDIMGTSPLQYRKSYLENLKKMKIWNLFEKQ